MSGHTPWSLIKKAFGKATGYEPKLVHCDELVIHRPGECVFCDKYGREQQDERLWRGINFTGYDDPSLEPDPASVRRPLEIINRWSGNQAKTQDQLDEEKRQWNEFFEREFGEPT